MAKIQNNSLKVTDRTGATPNAVAKASAVFEVESTARGSISAPVMTTTQKNAISSPATALQVYDSTLNAPCYYNGSSWRTLSASSLTGTFTPNVAWSGSTVYTNTVTVTGANVGDKVILNINSDMATDMDGAGSWFLDLQGWVSATNTVTIRAVISIFTTFGATSTFNISVN